MTDADRQLLDLEARFYRHVGAKESAILDELGISPHRYYLRLNTLLDDPEALAHSPVLVNRLRRLRGGKARRLRVA